MRWMILVFLFSCAMTTPDREQELPSENEEFVPAPTPKPIVSPTQKNLAEVGCVEAPYQFCTTRRYRVEGVAFETGKDVLLVSSRATLDTIGRALIAQPRLRVIIEVHSDTLGSASFNMVLCQKRAEAIVAYLVGFGVPESQLEAKGMGETAPINPGTTAAAHAENRRVEIALHESVP